jgi:hypothetical protein
MKGAQDIQKEVRVPLDQMDVNQSAAPRRETPITGPHTPAPAEESSTEPTSESPEK